MPSFATRNLLICVVPTVIALLSVYWFRKKKKLKTILLNQDISQSLSLKEIANTSGECSDFADTLSDASSFASPESSEKSLRTKYSDIDRPSLDSVKSNICRNTQNPKLNSFEMESNEANHSVKSENALQNSKVLNLDKVIHVSDDSKSDLSPGCSAISNSNITNKSESQQLLSDDSRLNDLNGSSLSVQEETISPLQLKTDTEKKQMADFPSIETTDTLLKMIGFYGSEKHVLENGSLHSIGSNESAVSSQLSDIEKMQALETDSNDSHSSVLDENSLSYVSDDSEGRQPVELKNKGSLSSVLDENSVLSSLCDESEKSGNCDNSREISPKIKPDKAFKSEESDEVSGIKKLTLVSNHVEPMTLKKESKHCSKLFSSENSVQEIGKHEEVEICVDTNSPILKIDSDDSLTSSTESQRHSTLCESSRTALVSCDSPVVESNCPLSSVEESSKSCTPNCDTSIVNSSGDSPVISDCTILTNGQSSSDKSVHNRPIAETGSDVSVTDEPEIQDMNIASHIPVDGVIPENDREDQILNWEGELDANQSKLERADVTGPKVPENTSGHYVYEFELPQELCGRLIGKQGKHVKSIKERSNASVFIKRHPYDPQLKLVAVEGNRPDVTEALEIIRRKYPLSRYPMVTLVKTNMISATNILPESLQLHLPEGASCDVILSSLVSAGHFFLQQPTHPTYPSLSTLDQCMSTCYSQMDTPLLPHPVEPGVICAAPVLRGWYRAQVIYICENETDCGLKFVDYGGFSQASTSSLRQIRSDFMSLPFQASECYLANVRPVDPAEGWSAEATATFEELAQGQILQALLVEYASDGIPFVNLYRVQGISSMFINRELVERGLAIWVNNGQWAPP